MAGRGQAISPAQQEETRRRCEVAVDLYRKYRRDVMGLGGIVFFGATGVNLLAGISDLKDEAKKQRIREICQGITVDFEESLAFNAHTSVKLGPHTREVEEEEEEEEWDLLPPPPSKTPEPPTQSERGGCEDCAACQENTYEYNDDEDLWDEDAMIEIRFAIASAKMSAKPTKVGEPVPPEILAGLDKAIHRFGQGLTPHNTKKMSISSGGGDQYNYKPLVCIATPEEILEVARMAGKVSEVNLMGKVNDIMRKHTGYVSLVNDRYHSVECGSHKYNLKAKHMLTTDLEQGVYPSQCCLQPKRLDIFHRGMTDKQLGEAIELLAFTSPNVSIVKLHKGGRIIHTDEEVSKLLDRPGVDMVLSSYNRMGDMRDY